MLKLPTSSSPAGLGALFSGLRPEVSAPDTPEPLTNTWQVRDFHAIAPASLTTWPRRDLLKELIHGADRICNDQAFLFGAAFEGLPLRFWRSFTHSAILIEVPRPGVGPGRPDWSPACKAGLSASSSTGAHSDFQE